MISWRWTSTRRAALKGSSRPDFLPSVPFPIRSSLNPFLSQSVVVFAFHRKKPGGALKERVSRNRVVDDLAQRGRAQVLLVQEGDRAGLQPQPVELAVGIGADEDDPRWR